MASPDVSVSASVPGGGAPVRRDDGTGLVLIDPWLEPYSELLRNRFKHYQYLRGVLDAHGGVKGEMTAGHLYFREITAGKRMESGGCGTGNGRPGRNHCG